MIRIVGIERNPRPEREFILLQNQGMMRQTLRGHAVVPECALSNCDAQRLLHLFVEDVHIPPGAFVMMRTGIGDSRWTRTRDGSVVFNVFMQRTESVWEHVQGPIHVMCTQHTFVERTVPAITLR